MQTVKAIIVILICVVLLGACGLKGPLYLPDEKPEPKPASGQDSASNTDDTEKTQDEENNEKKKSDSG